MEGERAGRYSCVEPSPRGLGRSEGGPEVIAAEWVGIGLGD